jgi:hypothetical protein
MMQPSRSQDMPPILLGRWNFATNKRQCSASVCLWISGGRLVGPGLIRNQGLTRDPTLPAEPEFDAVVDHSAYRAAVDRGAVPIWMPRLYAAKAIEDRRLLFGQARDGDHLGLSDRSRTHHWLRVMDEAFWPIETWLP